MAAYIRQRPAGWFTPAAVVLVLWGLLGCAALAAHVAMGPAINPDATEWDRAYYAGLPGWFSWVYAAAVLGGLFGAIALVARSKLATSFFIVSLIGLVVQFGYVFLATDLIAHKGAMATVPFPLFLFLVAGFQIWFASYARRRGWIS